MLNGYKTYLGIALTFLVGVGAIFGVAPLEQTPAWMDAVFMLLTSLVAWYGRRDKERRSPE